MLTNLTTQQIAQQLLEVTSDAVILWLPSGEIIYWNQRAEDLYEFKLQDYSGEIKDKLLHAIYPVPLAQIQQRLILSKRWDGEVLYTSRTGKNLVVESHQVLITEDDGRQFILETNCDVTAKKEMEQKLQTLQEDVNQWRDLVNFVPANIWVANPAGETIYVSDTWCKYTGLAYEDALGWDYVKTVHPDDQERTVLIWKRALQKGIPYETFLRWRRYDGEYRWCILQAKPVKGKDGRIVSWFGAIFDIDELKKTQEDLATSTAFLLSVIESTPDVILMKNREGKFVLVNHATTEMFGKPIEEILGYDDRKFFPPDIARTLMETDQRVMTTEIPEAIEETLPTATSEKTYLTTKSPLRNTKNEVIGLVVVARNITERKDIERQKDDFMGVVSHELKTPVTSIKAFTQVLHNRFIKAGDERSAELLAKMDLQINKLTTLIADLLDVTKIETGKLKLTPGYFSFEELSKEIIEEIQRTTTKHRILLESGGKHTIYGDRERIGQVLINLLTNAIKYSPHTEKIMLRTQADDHTMTVCVQDSGIGIPEDKQAHLFERFYRVSGHMYDTIPGLGLGLYISTEIIKRHEGRIWVESEVNKGSLFYFTLPIRAAVTETISLTPEEHV